MEIQKENLLLEQFEKTTTFKRFFSTLLRFDEDLDCFVATEKWRDKEAELLTAAWWMFSEVAKTQAVPEGFVLVRNKPVAFLVQNKSWTYQQGNNYFEAKLLKEMPEPAFDGDSYDIEIPLYMSESQEQSHE